MTSVSFTANYKQPRQWTHIKFVRANDPARMATGNGKVIITI